MDSKDKKAIVLLIGSGGREHTMAWKIAQSPKVAKVYVAPGNGGVQGAKLERLPGLQVDDHKSVIEECKKLGVTLVAVGPEAPLAKGIADFLNKNGVKVFGPEKKAAEIEASKVYSLQQYSRPFPFLIPHLPAASVSRMRRMLGWW
eukprot:1341422-Amorphochlora_amoeboformis.AAC.2